MRKLKPITPETREKRIRDLIAGCKFLSNPKYHKTNKISCAAWDSWAAQGTAGGCHVCNVGHYNYSFHNKRHPGKRSHWTWNEMFNLCGGCYSELEKQVNYTFEKY